MYFKGSGWYIVEVIINILSLTMAAAGSSGGPAEKEKGEEEDESIAVAAAEARMQSVQRGFAAAKKAGVPAATRLMKELRQVCLAGTFEVELLKDDLRVWQVPSRSPHTPHTLSSKLPSSLPLCTLRIRSPTLIRTSTSRVRCIGICCASQSRWCLSVLTMTSPRTCRSACLLFVP